MFYDVNADGDIDRIIMNNSKDEEASEDNTFLKNAMYAFQSMENIATEAEVVAALNPEDIIVANINYKTNEVEFSNLKTGGSGVMKGEEAEKFINQMQTAYNNQLESIVETIDGEQSN